MSNALLNAAWKTNLPGTAKLVLVCLADFARPDGRVWLPIEGPKGLAQRCGLARRTVQRAVATLVQHGYLIRQERPGCGVLYVVQLAADATAPPVLREEDSRAAPAPNPLHIQNNECRAAGEVIGRPPHGVRLDQWQGFVDLRVALGRPLTARAADLIRVRLAALASHDGDAGAILDQSVMNGWANVFPVRGPSKGVRSTASASSDASEKGSPPRSSRASTKADAAEKIERCTPEQAAAILAELGICRR